MYLGAWHPRVWKDWFHLSVPDFRLQWVINRPQRAFNGMNGLMLMAQVCQENRENESDGRGLAGGGVGHDGPKGMGTMFNHPTLVRFSTYQFSNQDLCIYSAPGADVKNPSFWCSWHS